MISPVENKNPIRSQISSVILWSRNLEKSAEQYSKLFNLSNEQQERFDHLHILHLPNGMDIMIDSNGMDNIPVPDKGSPLCFVPAEDIDEAAALIESLGFQIIYGGIMRNEYVSFFNMRDDDFNVITVCQNHN
ncbi:hypothetical protein BBG47_24845 [Paenibacillus sp. KS1]|uniref:VOC family protein n=1 Tax=Paenibacillus sp. KS1 TaxID=1849249 RepID=UPI00080657D1|nr:glyoxalase/bleomycin resistance/dioxygenase family protein [Paenibacillus sp. KS1]OBY76841.1 hypothetical protein BBG47_24845 [Paenibacillus sp. KS1]